jgi:hypothetical protein
MWGARGLLVRHLHPKPTIPREAFELAAAR